jgi:site-specific recombinase XerD
VRRPRAAAATEGFDALGQDRKGEHHQLGHLVAASLLLDLITTSGHMPKDRSIHGLCHSIAVHLLQAGCGIKYAKGEDLSGGDCLTELRAHGYRAY